MIYIHAKDVGAAVVVRGARALDLIRFQAAFL